MKRSLLFFVLLAWAGLLAAGCTTPRVDAMLQATPTAPGESPMEGAPADDMPTDEPPAAPANAPTLVDLPSTLPELDANCIDCHSDAELLQALAEEPEVVEVPSEGSG